jgi:hypothetical protein
MIFVFDVSFEFKFILVLLELFILKHSTLRASRVEKMASAGIRFGVGVLKVIAFFFDIILFPFYWCIQKPWTTRANSAKIKVRQKVAPKKKSLKKVKF